MGEALGGSSTSFDIDLHNRAVKKFQQISDEILTLLGIMLERKGKVGDDLIVASDQVVDETLAGELDVRKTQVETTKDLALTKVRTEMDRVEYDKIKLQAERTEKARVEVVASREDGDDPNQGNAPRVNRVTRFQATESVRKPEIMDVDDKYGAYFNNMPKMKAYYRDAAIPDGFTPSLSSNNSCVSCLPRLQFNSNRNWRQTPCGQIASMNLTKSWKFVIQRSGGG